MPRVSPLPLKPEYIQMFHEAPDSVVYARSHRFVYRVVRIIGRLNIVGAELLPSEGSYIYMPSHRSQLDPLIAGVIPKRAVYFMAKKEIWEEDKFRRLGIDKYVAKRGAFPVDRDNKADRKALVRSMQIIRDGHVLGLFAE